MVNINLLPLQDRTGGTTRRARVPSWVIPGGLALTLVLTGASFSLRQIQEMGALRGEMRMLDQEKEKYSRQLAQIQDSERRRDELGRRLQAVEGLERDRGQQVEVMRAVMEAMPTGLWLVELTTDPSGHTHLEGRALHTLAVFSFMSGLEAAGPFGGASLTYLRRDAEAESGVAQFVLELTPAAASPRPAASTTSET